MWCLLIYPTSYTLGVLHPVLVSLWRAALCGGYPIIGRVIAYLLSNLLSGFYCSPCDIGFASLGAIKTASVSPAIIHRRSYLHSVSFSPLWAVLSYADDRICTLWAPLFAFGLRFPLCRFVCLFATLFMGRPCIRPGQRMGEMGQAGSVQ